MKSSLCSLVVLALFAQGTLAGDKAKVLIVPKEGLKIDGTVKQTDPKVVVKSPDPKVKSISIPAKVYLVKMSVPTIYRIEMNAENQKELDSFLVIQDKDGKQLAFDDDSGGGLNALLLFSPPNDGTYKIFAAALENGGGKFTLKISVDAPGKDKKKAEKEKKTAKELESGKAVEGGDQFSFRVSVDGPDKDKEPAKEKEPAKVLEVGKGLKIEAELKTKSITYQVKMAEGKTYIIDMKSPNFKNLDPFLRLQDSAGKLLAEDDDGGEDLNARIVFRAPASATYQVVATSFGPGAGPFTMEIKEKE